MNQFIQPLENRVLMSVTVTAAQLTADVKTITADATATRLEMESLQSVDKAFLSTLTRAVKKVDTSSNQASNAALLSDLRGLTNFTTGKSIGVENSSLNATKTESKTAAADGKTLLAHPNKISDQKAVTKDINLLLTIPPGGLSRLTGDLSDIATLTAEKYTELVTANPTLATLVATGQTNETANANSVAAAANQVVTAASQLATDLGGPA